MRHRLAGRPWLYMRNVFVGAAGSPCAAFRRAIEVRDLTRAHTEARDLPQMSLADAAELVVLAAEQRAGVFDLWASRWAARYALELPGVALDEALLVLAALSGLRQQDRRAATLALIAIFKARRRPELERPFRRLLAAT